MKDPIVEQVRRVKEKLAAKFGYDIDAICEDARRRQWDAGKKVSRWHVQRGRFVEVKNSGRAVDDFKGTPHLNCFSP